MEELSVKNTLNKNSHVLILIGMEHLVQDTDLRRGLIYMSIGLLMILVEKYVYHDTENESPNDDQDKQVTHSNSSNTQVPK